MTTGWSMIITRAGRVGSVTEIAELRQLVVSEVLNVQSTIDIEREMLRAKKNHDQTVVLLDW
jgi:hypothetical protein